MSTLTAPETGIRCPGCRCVVEGGEACGERPEGMLGADVLVELTCVRCGDGAEACEDAHYGSNRRSVDPSYARGASNSAAARTEHGCWPMCRDCKNARNQDAYVVKKSSVEASRNPWLVYSYADPRGVVIYVGMTGRGTLRMVEHHRSSTWFEKVSTCTLEHFATQEAASLREQELIRALRPLNNVVFNQGSIQSNRGAK